MHKLTLLCAALVTVPVVAAENDSKAIFAKHWQTAKEFTLAVAEAMPAEGYDFKPNPEELSFGQLMIHIEARTRTVARARPEPSRSPSPPRPISRRLSGFSSTPLISVPKSWTPWRQSSWTRRSTNSGANRC